MNGKYFENPSLDNNLNTLENIEQNNNKTLQQILQYNLSKTITIHNKNFTITARLEKIYPHLLELINIENNVHYLVPINKINYLEIQE